MPVSHMTIRTAFLLCLLLILPSAAVAAVPATVKVVMDDNYPPYVFRDEQGQMKGIILDQWRLWEKKTGIKAEITGMDWGDAQRRMLAGEFDVIDTIFRNEKREKLYEFSRPYARLDVPLFFHSDISGISGPQDVKGFVVAAKAGDSAVDFLAKQGVTSIREYPSYEKIVQEAALGRVKVFTVDLPPAHYYLHKSGVHDSFRQTEPMYWGEFHRAVAKGRTDLMEILEKGFSSISDEEYAEIDKRWMGSPTDGTFRLRYLGYWGGIAAAVLVVMVLWLRMLKRSVAKKTRELAESEERYRSIINNMQDVYYRSDADGRLTMLSPSGAVLLGYENTEQMLGMVIRDTFYYEPEERDAFLHNLKVKQQLYGYEVTLKRRDGTPLAVATSTHMLFSGDSKFIGVEGVFRDITLKQEAERALRASEDKFNRAFKEAPLLMTISDIQTGCYLEVNKRFCEISGFTPEDALGRTSVEIGWISEEERNRLIGFLKRDGRVKEIEVPLTAKGGRPVLCLYSAEIIEVDGRERLLSIAVDLTEQSRTNELLRLSEERYRVLFNAESDAIVVIDTETFEHIDVNESAVALYGYSREELLGLAPTDLSAEPDDTRRQISTADGIVRIPLRYHRKKDGTVFPVEVAASFFMLGNKRYLLAAMRDISERLNAQELLRESEERYRRLVEQSAAWIWETDASLRHTYSNRNVERILGYTPEEICNIRLMDVVHPDDQDAVKAVVDSALKSRASWNSLILRWKAKNGTWRIVESSGIPVFDSEGRFSGLRGVDIEVTDRMQVQQEREKNQRLESLGLLAGGIAHDFNNILTGILGNISLARLIVGEEHRVAARLRECENAAVKASELTRQLLTFSRGGEPVRKSVDTAALVRESVSFTLRGSNVKALVTLDEDLWNIDADEGQINQVLNNLLINAKQAMPNGGEVCIRGTNMPAENLVRLSIRDSGAGISDEEIGRIFDPYYTTKSGGTGLGLASVYSIVTRHGGTVSVSSRKDDGAEFVVCLPACHEVSATSGDGSAAADFGVSRGLKVLVMDDEDYIREIASEMLQEIGCTVDACPDGESAAVMYRKAMENGTPYDLAILDLTVPGGMGGLEAAGVIREADPGARLLVSSGYSNDSVISEHTSYGFSGSIMKPYTVERLREEIATVMKMKGPDQPRESII